MLVALGPGGDDRATISRKLAVLAEHRAALGRDPAKIEKMIYTRLGDGESAEQFRAATTDPARQGIPMTPFRRGRPGSA